MRIKSSLLFALTHFYVCIISDPMSTFLKSSWLIVANSTSGPIITLDTSIILEEGSQFWDNNRVQMKPGYQEPEWNQEVEIFKQ